MNKLIWVIRILNMILRPTSTGVSDFSNDPDFHKCPKDYDFNTRSCPDNSHNQ